MAEGHGEDGRLRWAEDHDPPKLAAPTRRDERDDEDGDEEDEGDDD
jgi:hypothetical protein